MQGQHTNQMWPATCLQIVLLKNACMPMWQCMRVQRHTCCVSFFASISHLVESDHQGVAGLLQRVYPALQGGRGVVLARLLAHLVQQPSRRLRRTMHCMQERLSTIVYMKLSLNAVDLTHAWTFSHIEQQRHTSARALPFGCMLPATGAHMMAGLHWQLQLRRPTQA